MLRRKYTSQNIIKIQWFCKILSNWDFLNEFCTWLLWFMVWSWIKFSIWSLLQSIVLIWSAVNHRIQSLIFVEIKVVILFLKLVILKFAINHLSALLEAIIEAAIIFQGWVKVVIHDFFNSNYGGLMRHK